MKRLEMMKEQLIVAAQGQMGDLRQVDAKELGEVIDMIKDLEEAIYYCTITKAMKKSEESQGQQQQQWQEPRYYGEPSHNTSRSNTSTSQSSGNGRMYYTEKEYPITDIRDMREGRSPITRKMYMESRRSHTDKSQHLRDLEAYMQELGSDLSEMIAGASPEEKQLMQRKLTTLSQKIQEA